MDPGQLAIGGRVRFLGAHRRRHDLGHRIAAEVGDPPSKGGEILAVGNLGVRRQSPATACAAIANPGIDELYNAEHTPDYPI